jgi:hypothetical protein
MTAAEGEAFIADARLAGAFITVGLVALFGGVVTGLLQALTLAGVETPAHFLVRSYYHSVSLHGVLNVLVFTTFFIAGFVPFLASHALATPQHRGLGWATFWVMMAGLVLAAIPLVANAATVMFTFYPPLRAPWAFYVGLTLVVVGTWMVTLNLTFTWRRWRAAHPGQRTPLAAFMSLVTFAMWTIASAGLAAEMLFLLIPWSLGLVSGTDALLARTLFWFTGHPIVYFWLLPAYISWYTLVPRHAGGKLFSDPSPGRRSSCSSSSPRRSASITSPGPRGRRGRAGGGEAARRARPRRWGAERASPGQHAYAPRGSGRAAPGASGRRRSPRRGQSRARGRPPTPARHRRGEGPPARAE